MVCRVPFIVMRSIWPAHLHMNINTYQQICCGDFSTGALVASLPRCIKVRCLCCRIQRHTTDMAPSRPNDPPSVRYLNDQTTMALQWSRLSNVLIIAGRRPALTAWYQCYENHHQPRRWNFDGFAS